MEKKTQARHLYSYIRLKIGEGTTKRVVRGGVWCQLTPPVERICQVTAVVVYSDNDSHLGIPARVADLVMKVYYDGSGYGVREIWAPQAG